MLGVEPAGDLRMPAELVHGAVVVEAPIDVARAAFVAPDVAELAVDIRLAFLHPIALEVPLGARVGVGGDLIESVPPLIPREIPMP